jgi:hypothetical protein
MCQVVDVNAALSREQRDRKKDPEVASPFTHLECGFHTILGQLVLKLDKVIHGVRVVGINRDPLAPLVQRVDGVETYGELSLQVVADGFLGQQEWSARFTLLGAVVINNDGRSPGLAAWTGGYKRGD